MAAYAYNCAMNDPSDDFSSRAVSDSISDALASSRKQRLRSFRHLLYMGFVLVPVVAGSWWLIARNNADSAKDDLQESLSFWITGLFNPNSEVPDYGFTSAVVIVSLVVFAAAQLRDRFREYEIVAPRHRDQPDCLCCQGGAELVRQNRDYRLYEAYQLLLSCVVWVSFLLVLFCLASHREIGAVVWGMMTAVSVYLLWDSVSISLISDGAKPRDVEEAYRVDVKRREVIGAILPASNRDDENGEAMLPRLVNPKVKCLTTRYKQARHFVYGAVVVTAVVFGLAGVIVGFICKDGFFSVSMGFAALFAGLFLFLWIRFRYRDYSQRVQIRASIIVMVLLVVGFTLIAVRSIILTKDQGQGLISLLEVAIFVLFVMWLLLLVAVIFFWSTNRFSKSGQLYSLLCGSRNFRGEETAERARDHNPRKNAMRIKIVDGSRGDLKEIRVRCCYWDDACQQWLSADQRLICDSKEGELDLAVNIEEDLLFMVSSGTFIKMTLLDADLEWQDSCWVHEEDKGRKTKRFPAMENGAIQVHLNVAKKAKI